MPDPGALRVALLSHSVNPRGAVMHTLELAAALHAAAVEVTVMLPALAHECLFRTVPFAVELVPLPAHAPGTASMVRARIDAFVSHLGAPQHSRRSRGAFAPRAGAERFDVVHAQDAIGGNALATLCERQRVPGYLRTVHHVDRHDDAQLDAWQRRAIHGAHQVLCVSDVWRRTLERDYGVSAALVGNGVDLRRFSPVAARDDAEVAARLGLKAGAPLVVGCGGIEPRKNTVRLLAAFLRLRSRWPRAQLAVVGGATLLDHGAYAREFAATLAASGLAVGAGKDLVITRTLRDHDVPAVLRLADAVACPSIVEGFGLVALESLASGTPTVVSRIAPFTEYLSGRDVHWADPWDAESIAAALALAVAAPKFAPPPVCRRLSWAASAARHIELYHRFVASHRPTRH